MSQTPQFFLGLDPNATTFAREPDATLDRYSLAELLRMMKRLHPQFKLFASPYLPDDCVMASPAIAEALERSGFVEPDAARAEEEEDEPTHQQGVHT